MKRTRAFTLVELLVVVAIISLLVTILVPTLTRARDLARRATCAANLSAVGKAVSIYMTGDAPAGRGPSVGNNTNARWDAIGAKRTEAYNPANSTAQCPSRDWWMLVVQNMVQSAAFLCTAVPGVMSPTGVNADGTPWEDFKADLSTDAMPKPRGLTYSLQLQRKGPGYKYAIGAADSSSLVIAADRSPIATAWEAFDGGGKVKTPDSALKTLNSASHGQEQGVNAGQNVLCKDASAKWASTPRAGVDGDNIWTASLNDTAQPDGADVTYDATQFPYNRNDTLLAP